MVVHLTVMWQSLGGSVTLPGWKEGIFNSQSLPRMEHLALANKKNITDPSLGTQDSCGLNCGISDLKWLI